MFSTFILYWVPPPLKVPATASAPVTSISSSVKSTTSVNRNVNSSVVSSSAVPFASSIAKESFFGAGKFISDSLSPISTRSLSKPESYAKIFRCLIPDQCHKSDPSASPSTILSGISRCKYSSTKSSPSRCSAIFK